MPLTKAVMCLDSGTTRVKAAVYSTAGDLLGFAEAENTALRRDGSRLTQDMEETRLLNLSVLRECLHTSKTRVDAMIVSAQGDGLWALDTSRKPFMEGIVWLDSRARDVLSALEREGVLDAIREITLSKPTTASQTVLLRWLMEKCPADYARLGYALRLKDWLSFSLTGQMMTEQSNILPVWGDPRSRELSIKIPELLGLDKGLSILPEVREIRDCRAMLSDCAAKMLGIDYHFPVYVGPSDVQATAIGLGVGYRKDIASCSVFGTGSIHVGYAADPDHWQSPPPGSLIQPYALMPGYVCLHPGFNGTSIFNHIDRFTNSSSAGREIEPAPSDLLVLPFFEEGGERAPYTRANAHGAVFGLRASSTPDEIRWAARESLAFLGRVSQTMFRAGDVVAVGGGLSQDRHFMQFYADCLGKDLHCFDTANVGLYGLALLLTSIIDQPAFERLAEAPLGKTQTYRPRVELKDSIDRKFTTFEELVRLAFAFWDQSRISSEA